MGVEVVNLYCQPEKSKKWLGALESMHLVASVRVFHEALNHDGLVLDGIIGNW